MTETFTPGPWRVGRFEADGEITLVVDGPTSALGDDAVFGPQICERVHSEADAHLIAASPRLYRALDGLVRTHQALEAGLADFDLHNATVAEFEEAMNLAIEALAEARGEQT